MLGPVTLALLDERRRVEDAKYMLQWAMVGGGAPLPATGVIRDHALRTSRNIEFLTVLNERLEHIERALMWLKDGSLYPHREDAIECDAPEAAGIVRYVARRRAAYAMGARQVVSA